MLSEYCHVISDVYNIDVNIGDWKDCHLFLKEPNDISS